MSHMPTDRMLNIAIFAEGHALSGSVLGVTVIVVWRRFDYASSIAERDCISHHAKIL